MIQELDSSGRVRVSGQSFRDEAIYSIEIDGGEIHSTPDPSSPLSYRIMLSYLITAGPTLRTKVTEAGLNGISVYKELLDKVYMSISKE